MQHGGLQFGGLIALSGILSVLTLDLGTHIFSVLEAARRDGGPWIQSLMKVLGREMGEYPWMDIDKGRTKLAQC